MHLEGEKVQCGTCHNPHDNTNAPFLEASNTGSQLCLTCHLK
ncbi:MAG: cytochrome c3 family protein [Candidatus Hydrothermae bacterium]|nr:cytochrome c3 family protein [Candidatus Hydrothermae bacterium]